MDSTTPTNPERVEVPSFGNAGIACSVASVMGAHVPPIGTGRRASWVWRLGRRVLLLLHLAAALGWLGITSTFLVLTLWLLDIHEPATLRASYAVHELVVVWLARPAAIGSLVTGLLLVLASSGRRGPSISWLWWWVPAKLVLLIATVAVTITVSPDTLRYAVEHADEVGRPAYTDAQRTLVLMALYHVVMISAAGALAVFKPGRRFRKRRRLPAAGHVPRLVPFGSREEDS